MDLALTRSVPRVFQNASIDLSAAIQTVYVMSLIVSVLMMIGMAGSSRASKYGLRCRQPPSTSRSRSRSHFVKSVFAMAWAISAAVSAVPVSPSPSSTACRRALSAYASRSFPPHPRRTRLDRGACSAGIISGLLRNVAPICRQRVPALGQSLRDRAILTC